MLSRSTDGLPEVLEIGHRYFSTRVPGGLSPIAAESGTDRAAADDRCTGLPGVVRRHDGGLGRRPGSAGNPGDRPQVSAAGIRLELIDESEGSGP
jgi:hypothetical protein